MEFEGHCSRSYRFADILSWRFAAVLQSIRELPRMSLARLAAAIAVALTAALPAQAQLRCAAFTPSPTAAPAPRTDVWAQRSFERINGEVKTRSYRVLFLGDSITQRWELPLWDAKPVWDANMQPRGVLNAGVAGDRTEHLLWRLDHGNLEGPPPKVAIVLIGTNDLAHGRPPELAAQGVRAVLIRLRQKLPNTRILLLGLTPRGATANDPLRQEVGAVNNMIKTCADGAAIVYADIGGVLLDHDGVLSQTLSPDLLHFSGAGYKLLAPKLDPLIDQLLAAP
jgi:lysophospholipase L1-like esterase